MTQYNSLNVRLSNSQLNKLKSAIKNETDVVLRLSSNMIGNSDDNTNFPHELLFSTSVELGTDSVCLCVRHKTLGHNKILLRHQIP